MKDVIVDEGVIHLIDENDLVFINEVVDYIKSHLKDEQPNLIESLIPMVICYFTDAGPIQKMFWKDWYFEAIKGGMVVFHVSFPISFSDDTSEIFKTEYPNDCSDWEEFFEELLEMLFAPIVDDPDLY